MVTSPEHSEWTQKKCGTFDRIPYNWSPITALTKVNLLQEALMEK